MTSSTRRTSAPWRLATSAIAACALAACATTGTPASADIHPAPGAAVAGAMPDSTAARTATSDSIADARARRGYTAADVDFMQGMIAHHAQALAMTALVPERTTSDVLRLLAERIAISQRGEIARMQQWLRARGETVPQPGEDHGAHHAMRMPGMLTPEQMTRLAAAEGVTFDTLFLRDMIQHHEGALVMVGDLFGTRGAAQEPEVFRLASDVDADQRAEIARMRALLDRMRRPSSPSSPSNPPTTPS